MMYVCMYVCMYVLWLVVVNAVVGLKRVACAGNRVVCGRVW